MTKHELNACRLFLSDFPSDWTFGRILNAIEDRDTPDHRWIAVWSPMQYMARHDLADALSDAAEFLSREYGVTTP